MTKTTYKYTLQNKDGKNERTLTIKANYRRTADIIARRYMDEKDLWSKGYALLLPDND